MVIRSLFVVAGGLVLAGPGCASDPDPGCHGGASGTVCELAGTGEEAFTGDGKAAVKTAMYLPSEARRGPDGLLYLVDFNNMRLRRIEANGTMTTVIGDGFHAGATVGAPALQSSLENPIDFDFLPDGRIVLVSYHDPRVLVLDTDGTLQMFAGDPEQGTIGNEGDHGPPIGAQFEQTAGIAIAPDGTVYIADELANRVRVIRGNTIDTLAGTGEATYKGDGGPAKNAALQAPSALAVDAAGNVYISDAGNCAVRKVTPDGMISTVAGTGSTGYSGDDGVATSAELSHPAGIAVGPDGTLYVGDRMNNRVRAVAPDGTITTIGGTGDRGFSGDGGPATHAAFDRLARVQLDTDGGLIVTDQANGRIRKIQP